MKRRIRGVWPALVGAAFLGGVVVAAMTLLPGLRALNAGLTCLTSPGCSDLAAQRSMAGAAWVMAGFTFISMIVGAVGVWLVYSTLTATRESIRVALRGAKAAEKSAEQASHSLSIAERARAETQRLVVAQTRSYVTISEVTAELDTELRTKVTLKNSGTTPAHTLNLTIETVFLLFEDPDSEPRTLHHVSDKAFLADLAAGDEHVESSTVPYFRGDTTHVATEKGMLILRMTGRVNYQDVFGQRHTYPFAFEGGPNHGTGRQEKFVFARKPVSHVDDGFVV